MSHKKKIAVVLAGCGVYDGAEIHEATLTLYHAQLLGAEYQCFAPDVAQHHVVNHLDGSEKPKASHFRARPWAFLWGRTRAMKPRACAETKDRKGRTLPCQDQSIAQTTQKNSCLPFRVVKRYQVS